jgi:hypothetical protein
MNADDATDNINLPTNDVDKAIQASKLKLERETLFFYFLTQRERGRIKTIQMIEIAHCKSLFRNSNFSKPLLLVRSEEN